MWPPQTNARSPDPGWDQHTRSVLLSSTRSTPTPPRYWLMASIALAPPAAPPPWRFLPPPPPFSSSSSSSSSSSPFLLLPLSVLLPGLRHAGPDRGSGGRVRGLAAGVQHVHQQLVEGVRGVGGLDDGPHRQLRVLDLLLGEAEAEADALELEEGCDRGALGGRLALHLLLDGEGGVGCGGGGAIVGLR